LCRSVWVFGSLTVVGVFVRFRAASLRNGI
jgi:hypothetical protein